jgi:hypothetical protein
MVRFGLLKPAMNRTTTPGVFGTCFLCLSWSDPNRSKDPGKAPTRSPTSGQKYYVQRVPPEYTFSLGEPHPTKGLSSLGR